jgi:hypothetical protein
MSQYEGNLTSRSVLIADKKSEICFADSDVAERPGRFAKCSIAAGLWRAVFLVDPFAAPCCAQRQRPFRARSILGIVGLADHDHLWRIASAFAHSGHVFILLPVQAFSALSVKWSGYEGFHRGFSLGTGAKSGTIKAAQSGLDVKSAGSNPPPRASKCSRRWR